MEGPGVAAERRRLSVSQCDPVGEPRRRSEHAEDTKDRYASLRKTTVWDCCSEDLAEVASGAARAVDLHTETDKDMKKKKSYGEKDVGVTVPPGLDVREMKAWLGSLNISCACHKGLKPESPNQDSFSICIVENKFALYGVYDGHGPVGHDVSDLVRDILVKLFLLNPRRKTNVGQAFTEAFVETQAMIQHAGEDPRNKLDPSSSGATTTMCYHDYQTGMITVAHVGDSRAIVEIGGRTEDLTVDHKPNLDKERKRIEAAGGRVIFDGFYNHRVFAKDGMYPGLNMSRALGDVTAHLKAGLTAEPDIKQIPLKDVDAALVVICTDGVWEFIESPEAISLLASKGGSDQAAMEELCKESWNRWMKDSDSEIADDITGIMFRVSRT